MKGSKPLSVRATIVRHADAAIETLGLGPRQGHVYEFGSLNANAAMRMWDALTPVKMWAITSAEVIPSRDAQTCENVKAAGSGTWYQGAYHKDVQKLIEQHAGRGNMGWYNQSLSNDIAGPLAMKPARYVGIDCDDYSSAHAALDFMFRSRLIEVGTLIGYDNLWSGSCGENGPSPLHEGEGRAHAELAAKYRVQFHCAAGSCLQSPSSFAHAVFMVLSIGRADHWASDIGFSPSVTDVANAKRKNPACHAKRLQCNQTRVGLPPRPGLDAMISELDGALGGHAKHQGGHEGKRGRQGHHEAE